MSEQIIDFSEISTVDTEKIGSRTEKIEASTEKIPEIIPEIKRYRGQRGPDKAHRSISVNSLRNLKPLQNATFEQTNDSDKWIWIIIGIVIAVIAIILSWKIYEWWKEKQEEKGKTEKSFVVLLNSNR